MNENIEAFIVHISSLTSKMAIYSTQKAQSALLLVEEVTVLAEYADFVNVFSKKLAEVLPEQTGINEHAIKLKEDK